MEMKPITPNQCKEAQKTIVPDWIIAAFNELIIQKFDGNKARINEYDLEPYFDERNCDFFECDTKGMLKIIPLYKESGWEVNRDFDNDINEHYWEFIIKNC